MSDTEQGASGLQTSGTASLAASLPVSSDSGDARDVLILEREDAAEIIERLRETHIDVTGHAFLLKLDTLIVRLGARWDAKCDLVFEHLKSGFERNFQEPNWCIAINGDAWLAMLPEVSSRKGALAVADIWRELCGFFVGDMSALPVPVHEVMVEDVDRLAVRRLDLNTYVGIVESDDAPIKARAASHQAEAPVRAPGEAAQTSVIQRPVMVAATVIFGGRNLKVASSIEPLFEMKKMALIGHRLETLVMENADNTLLDRKSLSNLDWNLREVIDMTNIDQGLKLLKLRTPEQRKMMMVVPAAFSTFASARARQKITSEVSKAASEMGLKVLFEVRGLDGVPPHRVLEIVSMIKPFCMTVVGSVSADRKIIAGLTKCGLSGICVEYDGGRRDEDALKEYLTTLSAAAKLSAGACMVQGFDNYRQMAVARLAGVTHASMKAAALMSARPVTQVSSDASHASA